MTNQQLFSKVAKHLLTQKKRSMDPHEKGMCAYRGKNNLRCAIGALIPNTRYWGGLEGLGVEYTEIKEAAGLQPDNYELAAKLQSLHDLTPPSRWLSALRRLATDCNLQMPKGF
jgi:hypothetical protein